MNVKVGFEIESDRVPNDEEISHTWKMILGDITRHESIHAVNTILLDQPMKDSKKSQFYEGTIQVEFDQPMKNGEYLFKRILLDLGIDTLTSALVKMNSDFIILVDPQKSDFKLVRLVSGIDYHPSFKL